MFYVYIKFPFLSLMNRRVWVSDPKVRYIIFKKTSLRNIRLNVMEITQGEGSATFHRSAPRGLTNFQSNYNRERMPFQLLQLTNSQAR